MIIKKKKFCKYFYQTEDKVISEFSVKITFYRTSTANEFYHYAKIFFEKDISASLDGYSVTLALTNDILISANLEKFISERNALYPKFKVSVDLLLNKFSAFREFLDDFSRCESVEILDEKKDN